MLQDRVLAQNMVGIGTVYKKTRAVMQISFFCAETCHVLEHTFSFRPAVTLQSLWPAVILSWPLNRLNGHFSTTLSLRRWLFIRTRQAFQILD